MRPRKKCVPRECALRPVIHLEHHAMPRGRHGCMTFPCLFFHTQAAAAFPARTLLPFFLSCDFLVKQWAFQALHLWLALGWGPMRPAWHWQPFCFDTLCLIYRITMLLNGLMKLNNQSQIISRFNQMLILL